MINGKKVVGVVTEFNPFHDGHAFFLQEIRKKYAADYIVAVMSGDFVQRGEPAFFSKFERGREAIKKGVDLLVQLPVIFSLSGSRDFAYGSIKLLHELGFVDQIVFGSESGNLQRLKEITSFLQKEEENPDFQKTFRSYLAKGFSYPAARDKAIQSYFPDSILPNDNLGISYLRAIDTIHTKMEIDIIFRDKNFSSAHSLREKYREENQLLYADIERVKDYLFFRIMELERDEISLSTFQDVHPELAERIVDFMKDIEKKQLDLRELIKDLKGKNHTYSRISRALMHILLNIRKEDIQELKEKPYPYFRILGCSSKGEDLLSFLPKNSIMRLGQYLKEHQELMQNRSLKIDLFAGRIFQSIYPKTKDEFREFFIKI